MRATWKENPAWLNRALAKNLEHVQAVAPPAWMPSFTKPHLTRGPKPEVAVDFQEYGCGNYGCVLPTRDTNIVMKITTDQSEVDFVVMGMPWGWPPGITQYVGVLPLEGVYKLTKKFAARPAAILWRESARHVGKMDADTDLDVDERLGGIDARMKAVLLWDRIYDSGSTAYKFLVDEGDGAKALYDDALARRAQGQALARDALGAVQDTDEFFVQDVIDAAADSPALQLAAVFEVYRQTSIVLEHNPAGVALGYTLRWYLQQHGILMGDLHRGNVGFVDRGGTQASGGSAWAITDPGHIAVLGKPWR